MSRRVVITGMGVMAPNGNGLGAFRKALRAGTSGEGPITCFDASCVPPMNVFEVKDFNPKLLGVHFLDPFIQYAIASATEAIENAHFDPSSVDPYRIGISMSSSKGGVHTIDRFKERFKKNPSAILGARIYSNAVPNFAAQWTARRWKTKGASKCYVAACATGTVAIAEGVRMVAFGDLDYCIAGASDASIVPLMLAGYHNMRVLSPESIRPFDKSRQGFLVGEGAGVVFLETYESAKARGAKIHGEVLGFQYANDCSNPIHFDPKEHALSRALTGLLAKTDMKPLEVDYINLHGTGTKEGDLYETNEIKHALGDAAQKVPMSSTKSMTGHMLGASGAVEVIASCIAMEEGFIPPTIGLREPDPECDLDYTPQNSRDMEIKKSISLSMGFGGHVATIALGKVG